MGVNSDGGFAGVFLWRGWFRSRFRIVERSGVFAPLARLAQFFSALVVEHGNQHFGEGDLTLCFVLFAVKGCFGFQIEQHAKEGDFAFEQSLHESRRNGRPLLLDGPQHFLSDQPMLQAGARALAGRSGFVTGGFRVFVFVAHELAPENAKRTPRGRPFWWF